MSLSADQRAGPLVRMEGIVKRFGAVEALKGVDLDLQQGEAPRQPGGIGQWAFVIRRLLARVPWDRVGLPLFILILGRFFGSLNPGGHQRSGEAGGAEALVHAHPVGDEGEHHQRGPLHGPGAGGLEAEVGDWPFASIRFT